jgi:ABC-type phosphate transport system substrate-binding protein
MGHNMRTNSALPVALALFFLGGSAFAGDFVFVKSAQNTTAQAGKDELKEIFTGKMGSWKSGEKVEVGVGPSGSPELKWLAQELFGTSEDNLLAKIKQEVFKGDMKKPTQVASAQECFALVKKSPGGICVVDAESAKALPAGAAVLTYAK